MMKKLIKRMWRPRFWVPLFLAGMLIGTANFLEARAARNYSNGLDLQYAAFAMLNQGDPAAAYALFIESSVYSEDPMIRAFSLYNAANVAWGAELADYQMLVALYKESLRNLPGFYAASWNLEYLYFLKSEAPELLPEPGDGLLPGEEEYVPTGDI
ncbi:hypothetical protein A3J33_02025 [candidate division WWE3 bacterium RIFCSPLOWO2_02_FULL_53_10]|uniref:Tetratricopeptide repeat-like domain-containing protein n=2 Tax=Katanobacteria TaxID=422282 RepID=A0A1F4W3G7_UNCKA|nr:MAG: hypothetical protein A2890_01110 [candidate division WWE3 bacterium RIFCSPLOWO2_01_FULL_53_14]OGC63563.1 MAG: hypothetical protein A3J33_02025 [candidate division WWE3 bacterium RIFCSPLOWO2_02_FULL_53_10]